MRLCEWLLSQELCERGAVNFQGEVNEGPPVLEPVPFVLLVFGQDHDCVNAYDVAAVIDATTVTVIAVHVDVAMGVTDIAIDAVMIRYGVIAVVMIG